jgi:hypothetical protein
VYTPRESNSLHVARYEKSLISAYVSLGDGELLGE